MKLTLRFSFLLAACLVASSAIGQRYVDSVFAGVTVTKNVQYGTNISVLTGSPTPTNLVMDVYEPTGDAASTRALVILAHTGSFLPPVINGQPTGSKTDSAIVEMATKFAQKGYVVAAINYRLGWNPSGTQEVRTGTLINAAYRGVQDAKTAIRYFRKDFATTNTFRIDTSSIALGGIGTGGYISLAAATFDNVQEELFIPKFIDYSGSSPKPYIDTAVSGDFNGTVNAPLNMANHVGYSSNFHMAFNVGGALGDSSWMEADEMPILSLQTVNDQNAPYMTGPVIVPTTGDFVLEASGSYHIARRANYLGLNSRLKNAGFQDPYTWRANSINDGYEGLFPFIIPDPTDTLSCTGVNANPKRPEGAPWDWWNESYYINAATAAGQPGTVMNCLAKLSNPNDPVRSRRYIDTIVNYISPRMAVSLYLISGIKDHELSSTEIAIYPNPAKHELTIKATEENKMIESIMLFDITGKLIFTNKNVDNYSYTLSRNNFNSGIYLIQVTIDGKRGVKKIFFE